MSTSGDETGPEDLGEIIRQFVETSPEMSPYHNCTSPTRAPNPPQDASGNGGCNIESYLQMEVKLQAAQLEVLFLTTDNENMKAELEQVRQKLASKDKELEQVRQKLASKDKELNEVQAIKGLLSSSVLDLEEMAQSRQSQIDGFKIELEAEKRGKLEAERKVNDIREALKQLHSSVGNALEVESPAPSSSASSRGTSTAQVVRAASIKSQNQFDGLKKDRQKVKDGLGFMKATLTKVMSDLKVRRSAKKSKMSRDPEPPTLEKVLPVPVPPTPARSPVASTSAAALSQPMDVDRDDDDEIEEAPPILSREVPYRRYRQCKVKYDSRDIKPIIREYKKFACPNCHAQFHTLAGLRHHMAGRHKEVLHAEKKAGCRSCGKTFISVAQCLKHANHCHLRAKRALKRRQTE